jgi:hypothetical protein
MPGVGVTGSQRALNANADRAKSSASPKRVGNNQMRPYRALCLLVYLLAPVLRPLNNAILHSEAGTRSGRIFFRG